MMIHIEHKNKENINNKSLKGADGFTLLEVIMAISILTIGLLAVASMQVSAIRGNYMSRVYTESTEKAQDLAEKLLAGSLTDTELSDTDGDGNTGLDETGANADHFDDSDPTYTVYWNVAEGWAAGSAEPGINTVRVIVTWTDRGVARSRSFDLLKNRL
jgi:prepilin-type N-terminal cleavage/methylation domain-containing protein